MNNFYAQYGAIDFEVVYDGDEPVGFHALFRIYGVEASLDSANVGAQADSDLANVAALLYAESQGMAG